MYKNQLQELAQRSCFNLPAYACIREGPDHAPRFKATVIFNGELFESPNYCSTLRQAEHAAAEVALNVLFRRGSSSSQSLAARFFDETGVCKNLLQETAQRAGVSLPVYTTTRSGPGHLPVFTCSVEVAGMTFSGEAARTKKQAEKNAAMAAWSALKQLVNRTMAPPPSEAELSEEQEQNTIARALAIAYGKEGTLPSLQQQLPLQSGIGSMLPTRIRSLPSVRESCQNGGAGQFFSGSRITDLPAVEQQQRILRNQQQPHMSSGVSKTTGGPGYRLVGTQRASCSSVTLRDVSALSRDMSREALAAAASGLSREVSREALAGSRVIAGSMGNLMQAAAPVHVRNLGVRSSSNRDRHEVLPPLSEHQHDEDEWLRGESSKATTETDNRSDKSEVDHASSIVHGSYNPMSWSNSSDLWGMMHLPSMSRMPAGAAMPVRLRPSVTVCAAPPPRHPEPQDDHEDIGEAAAAATQKILNQLNL
ncbi:unnamed protein product [Sphagnum jensenii]|jgi:hypothetical protein|uniref:DRBM domain-containing protein n=1 Tax=Sphagnum jensenii TaxID=128206 RepID=A0ABP0WSV1_9BRYO